LIFVDTGALLARYVARDQHHETAVAAWERLARSRDRCLTSNFVLDETFTLLGRRAGYAFAAERARNIYGSTFLKILRPVEEDELEGLRIFEKYADSELSYTDCISFALMKRHRLKRAFTFDSHFRLLGFKTYP
jgi:predicted nucleic acid-binding protein